MQTIEHIGEKSRWLGFDDEFLDTTVNAQSMREMVNAGLFKITLFSIFEWQISIGKGNHYKNNQGNAAKFAVRCHSIPQNGQN